MSILPYVFIPLSVIFIPVILIILIAVIKNKLPFKSLFKEEKKELLSSASVGIFLCVSQILILLNLIMFEGIRFMEISLLIVSLSFILLYLYIEYLLIIKRVLKKKGS